MANPIDIDVSRDLHASPDAVGDVLTGLGRLPEWLDFASALERLDEISSGSG